MSRSAGCSDSNVSRTNFEIFRCLCTPRLHGEQQTPCVLQQEVWGGGFCQNVWERFKQCSSRCSESSIGKCQFCILGRFRACLDPNVESSVHHLKSKIEPSLVFPMKRKSAVHQQNTCETMRAGQVCPGKCTKSAGIKSRSGMIR